MLILHGDKDTNVPIGQAVYLHRALRRFGVEHEFVIYPRESHSIRERNHQLDLLRRTRSWFDRWLRPEETTPPSGHLTRRPDQLAGRPPRIRDIPQRPSWTGLGRRPRGEKRCQRCGEVAGREQLRPRSSQ